MQECDMQFYLFLLINEHSQTAPEEEFGLGREQGGTEVSNCIFNVALQFVDSGELGKE